MNITNPLLSDKINESYTQDLISKILKGDKEALNELLKQHQDYIFNVSLKVLNDVEDAEDVTQEILVKVVSNLAKFDASKSKFTTWIYRIAFNQTLSFKKSKIERNELTFSNFFNFIESVPNVELNEEEEVFMGESIEEARISCTEGMLMCLNREQRLIYIIGEVFRIDHNLAAEIFDVTPTNFRKKLSRTRKDLHQWMHKKCGLVNLENPCRCKSKTKKFIDLGFVNPDDYKWQSDYKVKINRLVEENMDDALIATDRLYANIHRNVPFKNTNISKELYQKIIQDKSISKLIDPLDD